MASPTFTGSVDLTPDVLRRMKEAGPDERGNYQMSFIVFKNDQSTSPNSPNHKGYIRVKGDPKEAPKGYMSVWDKSANSFGGNSSSDMPF